MCEHNLQLRQAEGDQVLCIFVKMNAPKLLDTKNLFKMKTLNIDRIYLHTNHKRFIYISIFCNFIFHKYIHIRSEMKTIVKYLP